MKRLQIIRRAAIRGSDEQLMQLIQQIPPAYAPLAATLRSWVQNFQFDKVIDFLQSDVPLALTQKTTKVDNSNAI